MSSYQRKRNTQLEQLASEFLKLRGHFFNGYVLLIEDVLDNMGYTIFPKKIGAIAEAYVAVSDAKVVIVDEYTMDRYECRHRFSLAEELAHILIGEKMSPPLDRLQMRSYVNGLDSASYLAFEKNAKFLAGALLMPKDQFSKRFDELKRGFTQETVSRGAVASKTLKRLSKEYIVSEQATGIRARDLDLITREDLTF
jgi:Zn-dependent peptidase ImmA (M78 family)